MNDPVKRSDFILAAALFALASFVGLRWASASSSDIAAWVQAFGTIGAVIGAAMIARWQFADLDTRRKLERQQRAAVTAYLLVPRYISLLNQLQVLVDLRDKQRFGTEYMESIPLEELIARLTISANIPHKFESEIHCFDALTAMSIAQTIAFADDYNSFVAEALPRLYASGPQFKPMYLAGATYRFNLVERAANQAWSGLARYHRNELAVMERL